MAKSKVLYDHELANNLEKRVRVIGTGNLSEDYIGYDTKGGDALVDISPIGELFKSEVYQMLDYYIENRVIPDFLVDRVPSAGLWESQTDEGEIGASYDDMEPHIRQLLAGTDTNIVMLHPLGKMIWERHINNLHKRMAPPVIGLRGLSYCGKRVIE